jgi:dihydroorotate dehydrogenase electron transfer subunit
LCILIADAADNNHTDAFMTNNHPRVNKGPFVAAVCANKKIGESFYRLGLGFEGEGGEAFAKAQPGQFAQIDLAYIGLPPAEAIPEDLADASRRKILLRRPFSFCDVIIKDKKTFVDILYCVVGPASLRMMGLSAGDSVSVIGPLGRGFQVPEKKKAALLVAGGMGAGPLIHLAKHLTADWPKLEVTAFAGARTAKKLPFKKRLDEISQELGFSLAEFGSYGIQSLVATDDGSAGYHGLVSDRLWQWLEKDSLAARDVIIYACGPEAMLERVAEIARRKNIDCQLSMERMMACGIGVCQSCAVECKANGSAETVYKLCCKDGPVFDGKEVAFSV